MSRIGWTWPSQPLKSPTTRTALARGAHTANDVPRTVPRGPGYSCTRAPRTVQSLLVPALADEVQVDLAEGGREPVGVVLDVLVAVAPVHEQAVVHGLGRAAAHSGPDALGLVLEGEHLAVGEPHAHRRGHRAHRAHAQPVGLEVLSEQVVRLLVPPVDEGVDRTADFVGGGRGHGVSSWGAVAVVERCSNPEASRSTAASGMSTHDGRLRTS